TILGVRCVLAHGPWPPPGGSPRFDWPPSPGVPGAAGDFARRRPCPSTQEGDRAKLAPAPSGLSCGRSRALPLRMVSIPYSPTTTSRHPAGKSALSAHLERIFGPDRRPHEDFTAGGLVEEPLAHPAAEEVGPRVRRALRHPHPRGRLRGWEVD